MNLIFKHFVSQELQGVPLHFFGSLIYSKLAGAEEIIENLSSSKI
jgi:hypothetical protein